MPIVDCFTCGKQHHKKPRDIGRYRNYFCSLICHAENRKRLASEARANAICQYCKANYVKSKNRRKGGYCSRRCSNKARTGISYLVGQPRNNAVRSSRHKKAAIFRDGPNCNICGLNPIWRGLPLTMQLDHIDGNRENNDPGNHRLLCPNCHTQTETYGPKNFKRKTTDSVGEGDPAVC